MKQSKWFKWQVGMMASVVAAFLFHEVKASPAFEQATTAANNGTTDTKISTDAGSQVDMDRWASQIVSGTGNSDTTDTSGSINSSSRNNQGDLSDSTSSSSDTFSRSRTGRS